MKNKFLKDKADKSLAVKLGIGAGCVLLIAAAGWYGWKTYYYTDHLFENTKINQLDCSNLTVQEAETFIKIRWKITLFRWNFERIGRKVFQERVLIISM